MTSLSTANDPADRSRSMLDAPADLEGLALVFAQRIVAEAIAGGTQVAPVFSAVVLGSSVWVEADPTSAMVTGRRGALPLRLLRGQTEARVLIVVHEQVLRALVAEGQSVLPAIDTGQVLVDGHDIEAQAITRALRSAFP